MIPYLIALAAVFGLLTVARIGGARRADLLSRWPVVVMAVGVVFALARGQYWFAMGLAGAACLAWVLAPPPARSGRGGSRRAEPVRPTIDRQDAEARAVLGVGLNATPDQIRAAYRAKMARAHPDLGGSHAEAARLTAARDRLLKR